jgi:hypothetical protein
MGTERLGRSYDLQLFFSYRAFADGQAIQRGLGETIEIGSTRIRVRLIEALSRAATGIVLSIAWPGTFQDGASLQLVVQAEPCWGGVDPVEFVIRNYQYRILPKERLSRSLSRGTGASASKLLPQLAGQTRV